MTPVTEADIEAGRSERGGFTAKQLAEWGVPWPPPSGWRSTIIAHGIPYDATKNDMDEVAGHEPHELLRKVVLAVVNAGHASDLYEFPDVLDYFGAQLPNEIEGEETRPDRGTPAAPSMQGGQTISRASA